MHGAHNITPVASDPHGKSRQQPLVFSGIDKGNRGEQRRGNGGKRPGQIRSFAEAVEDILIGLLGACILAGTILLAGTAFGAEAAPPYPVPVPPPASAPSVPPESEPAPIAPSKPESEYHTPLAGEQCDIECLGRKYALPPRNRENTKALVLGGSVFFPQLAGHTFIPIGAFYYKHRYDDLRMRGIFSIFVNEFDLSKTSDELQLLAGFDNNTIPFASKEIEDGKELTGTSVKWGWVKGRIGAGWRHQVAPFKMDNDLRVQLLYQLGYLYSSRTSDTSPTVVLPPDTLVYGPMLRVKYDGMSRNLMELPHQGFAAGMDTMYFSRGHWSDANYGGALFSKSDTQNYLKLSGYATAATPVPFLNEKNRLLFAIHGGFAPYGTLDRFSTFRIGGGPVPSEADDMERQVFPGAMFSQFPVDDYLIVSAEYRREIFSFLYLHLRGTYANVNREEFAVTSVGNFVREHGQALTAGFTSGFLLKSELHLEYTYDSSVLRSGERGSNIILLWSKSF